MGYAVMAMTACISGQLFNMIFGLGITLVLDAKKHLEGGLTFSIFKPS
jgi:Ca2+/Na+ antiporter